MKTGKPRPGTYHPKIAILGVAWDDPMPLLSAPSSPCVTSPFPNLRRREQGGLPSDFGMFPISPLFYAFAATSASLLQAFPKRSGTFADAQTIKCPDAKSRPRQMEILPTGRCIYVVRRPSNLAGRMGGLQVVEVLEKTRVGYTEQAKAQTDPETSLQMRTEIDASINHWI